MSTDLLERTAAGRRWDPRVSGGLILALVFLCGAAAGALAMNSGAHAKLHQQPAFDTPAGQTLAFDKLQKELNLTPAQSEQIQSILIDMWQYYRTVLGDSKSRVEQVLTEPQRAKFERLLQQQLLPQH
jgi:Spy/CpxP family protein refolding chaperone